MIGSQGSRLTILLGHSPIKPTLPSKAPSVSALLPLRRVTHAINRYQGHVYHRRNPWEDERSAELQRKQTISLYLTCTHLLAVYRYKLCTPNPEVCFGQYR